MCVAKIITGSIGVSTSTWIVDTQEKCMQAKKGCESFVIIGKTVE